MYKVFIENTPLHIVEKKDFIPNDVLVIYEGDLTLIKNQLFLLLKSTDNHFPIYLVSTSLENTFSKLFEGFDFIEAAGGIVKRKESYLFIKRNGFWDIPKGKLEKNESTKKAAIREVEEECGIKKPKIKDFIGLTYHTYLYKGKPTIKKTYWYSMEYSGSKTVSAQTEEGITKVKWFKKNELLKVRINTFSSILEVMDLYFK
jgi:8-oxo-dGTP pyrophosphatase MutT (NUDIX family)